jgi:hypothetical protein
MALLAHGLMNFMPTFKKQLRKNHHKKFVDQSWFFRLKV